jgi:transcriptional antiterminator RfaH
MNDPQFPNETVWYCVKSQSKHEHIAAAHLRLLDDVRVFCPRVRIQRRTRNGLRWFVEAMFPSYLFARFNLARQHSLVKYSQGVSGIVQFGSRFARVPDQAVEELMTFMGEDDLKTISFPVAEGDEVEVVEGPLQGQQGVVTKLLPARERVRVLLEFLGSSHEVELSLISVFRQVPVSLGR